MDAVALDIRRKALANGSFEGLGRVSGAHYFAQLPDRVFALATPSSRSAFRS